MLKDEYLSRLQRNAHRRVSTKSDDSTVQFATRIFLVVFGGRVPFRVDVQRTEGVTTCRKITTIGERSQPTATCPKDISLPFGLIY